MARHRSAEAVMSKVDIRAMVAGDAEMVLRWRNNPFIVARSTSQRGVPRDEHVRWVGRVINDPCCLCLIILVDGAPAGHMRFDRADDRAVVTVYLLEQFTGRGAGVHALTEGAHLAFARWPDLNAIDAFVRLDNGAARKAFRRAGFAPTEVTADGHEKFALTSPTTNDARMAWQDDTAATRAFFTATDKQFGIDVRAVNWGSRASQIRRFEVLAAIGSVGSDSVLDVGCGQGDFFEWLRKAGFGGEYAGIDITPRMIQTARGRFPDAMFREVDLLDGGAHRDLQRDWVFASGIFYLRRHEPLQYLKSMVREMFGLANKGLAFNSLSLWSSNKAEGEFFADPLQVLAFCHSMTPRVVLRHDYHPGDFTIYMFKEADRR